MNKKVSVTFLILTVVFTTSLITSNLLETKLINIGGLNITAGLLIFPISYIINDCIAEVYGYAKARLIIWLGFLMNLFVVLMGGLATLIPAASYWQGAEHFNFIFGLAPRIAVASFCAFIIGSFINAYVMSKMKIKSQGKHFSLRAIVSTLFGETADSLIFFPIAFWGIIPFRDMIALLFVQIFLKTGYEILVLPVTIQVVKRLKVIEKLDTYDNEVNYSIFKVKEM